MVFGKKKVESPEKQIKQAVLDEQPDLVLPANIGMPGFTEDAPAPAPQPVPALAQQPVPVQEQQGVPGFGSIGINPQPAPVQQPAQAPASAQIPQPVPAPVQQPVVKEQYQIIGAEMLPDGLYRYVIVTNKILGEVGGVYDA